MRAEPGFLARHVVRENYRQRLYLLPVRRRYVFQGFQQAIEAVTDLRQQMLRDFHPGCFSLRPDFGFGKIGHVTASRWVITLGF